MVLRRARLVYLTLVLLVLGFAVGAAQTPESESYAPDGPALLDLLRSLGLSTGRSYFLRITPEVQQGLDELNALIDKDVVMWVASMYDPETGGLCPQRNRTARLFCRH